jgi:hypothetical protein
MGQVSISVAGLFCLPSAYFQTFTKAGYGAVTEEGVIVTNEPLVRQIGLTEH